MSYSFPVSRRARMFFLPDIFMVMGCRLKKFREVKKWEDLGVPMRYFTEDKKKRTINLWGGKQFQEKMSAYDN